MRARLLDVAFLIALSFILTALFEYERFKTWDGNGEFPYHFGEPTQRVLRATLLHGMLYATGFAAGAIVRRL